MKRMMDHSRRGFTLIELMITILIIAIISAAMIAALNSARQTASQMRTQQLISRLNAHLTPKFESYRTRPVPVDPIKFLGINLSDVSATTANRPAYVQQIAWFRIWAMRDLMRMELPDAYHDITIRSIGPGGGFLGALQVSEGEEQRYSPYTPTRAQAMFMDEIWFRTQGKSSNSGMGAAMNLVAERNQAAECFFMIINSTVSDRDLYNVCFQETDVSDVDGDGMEEFVDGWGKPIQFIRWPAGFVSEVQPQFLYEPSDTIPGTTIKYQEVYGDNQPRSPDYPGMYTTHFPVSASSTSGRFNIIGGHHNAFDPYYIDRWEPNIANKATFADGSKTKLSSSTYPDCSWIEPPDQKNPGSNRWGFPERAYNLFPLIYSNGPDLEDDGLERLERGPIAQENSTPYASILNPYVTTNFNGVEIQRGSPKSSTFRDNIHNHHMSGAQGLQ